MSNIVEITNTEQQQQDNNNDNITSPNNSNKQKKVFTPNVVKHKFKNDSILSPTASSIKSQQHQQQRKRQHNDDNDNDDELDQDDIDQLDQQIHQHIANNTVKTTPDTRNNNGKATEAFGNNKKIFLKIKRKIDEEPVAEIIIERPKKRAFLDSFKEFSLNCSAPPTTLDANGNIKFEKEKEKPVVVEKNLFTLFSSVDEATLSKDDTRKTKIEQRFEDFREKGKISSPKILKAKQENTIKKRNETRYKQIKSNRELLGKEDANVIELERTDESSISVDMFSGLTAEEEKLICNFRPMLKEHLNTVEKQPKYVYDYYYLNTEQHADDMDTSAIETVQLPADDEEYGFDDVSDKDESVDSENWYTDYPEDEEEEASDSSDRDEDNDDYDNQEYYYDEEDDYEYYDDD
ncbi:hypothetical protein SAMD00019534_003800 [Acytostelium subglobosum LB1]|uniref:hypothetical protein n=1 Tax=Acytostelium subglobosum LB1 TaxID=1410327 RepID=UPI0006448E1B|nr:hypothetical protein SAMD00019534_003800 [Acytostelium subglobosum LB1]GAM17205.1 hypothetical protein SAMD00019534_003800 [Acytostelium subglobosum LB1]|eukprot:XP_012759267.1 hypothetical protein SAMD00019534_003800 [Acytostelium subglobosum LB1]